MQNGSIPEHWHREKVQTTSHMHAVIERLLGVMSAAGFSDKDVFCMRLAAEEAIVNALKHGNAGDSSKHVSVRFGVVSHQAIAEIEDQGPGFDPEAIPDPLAPENLERPFGRGLFLMRYYMTSVSFN